MHATSTSCDRAALRIEAIDVLLGTAAGAAPAPLPPGLDSGMDADADADLDGSAESCCLLADMLLPKPTKRRTNRPNEPRNGGSQEVVSHSSDPSPRPRQQVRQGPVYWRGVGI